MCIRDRVEIARYWGTILLAVSFGIIGFVDDYIKVVKLSLIHIYCLAPGGRFAIITFHSLEDRMVKQKFADLAKGCICPPDFPVCVCGRTPQARLITRKPILPSEEELAENNRSHSAKLRVCERI